MRNSNKIILIIISSIVLLAITNPNLKSYSENNNYSINQCICRGNYLIFSKYEYLYRPGRFGIYKSGKKHIGILGNFFEYDSWNIYTDL